MTRTVLVAGTASHVGKSTVAAGMCRLLADRGVDVAPFKAQNMSNNARAVATPDGGFGEIGVSQYVQARAARIHPTTDVNPVLLKPRGGGESQLVVHGEAVGHFRAGEYYDRHWERAREAAVESYERLAAVHDVIVAEGAGSAAEINFHDRDLANVETARFPERVAAKREWSGETPEPRSTEILLIVDIERGGAFASLVGTLELLPEDLRKRVIGVVVNKFRGDRSLLDPGIEQFEARSGVPVVGVLPYDDPGLPAEDSVSLPPEGERSVSGQDDASTSVTVAVPRLPHISNFTDFGPLAREPGVRVAWVPLEDPLDGSRRDGVGSSQGPHAVVLPGTKNTVADLLACREVGLGRALREFDGPVVGLCGGYQMLGKRIVDAGVEATREVDEVEGFGLLPIETRFSRDKHVERVTRELRGVGPLASGGTTSQAAERSGGRSAQTLGEVTGYEIHMGETDLTGPAERPFPDEGAAAENILGTYLHGLFENQIARDAFVEGVFAAAGRERPAGSDDRPAPSDRAAALLAEHLDLDALALPD